MIYLNESHGFDDKWTPDKKQKKGDIEIQTKGSFHKGSSKLK